MGLTPTHWDPQHSQFPGSLKDIPYSPKALHALGNPETLDAPRVAIVGTRHPTPYGERITRHLASTLAQAGASIVSGMALGIDSHAHQAALSVQGRTIAVLGTGIDVIYPPSNEKLYHQIASKGLVLSEYGPGSKPFRGCFPRRNRIIAGLAELTIVVEATQKSGALITAQYALDSNRSVAAVPGPIDSPTSQGTNHLLRDGAHLIATVDDALSLLNLSHPRQSSHVVPPVDLPPTESRILKFITSSPSTTDTLIHHLKLPTPQVLSALTILELHGLIEFSISGQISRR